MDESPIESEEADVASEKSSNMPSKEATFNFMNMIISSKNTRDLKGSLVHETPVVVRKIDLDNKDLEDGNMSSSRAGKMVLENQSSQYNQNEMFEEL